MTIGNPMCRLVIKETKQAPVRDVREFMHLLGALFIGNHKWKVRVSKASKPTPFSNETLITGHDLNELLKQDIKFEDATFSALEGDQILFRITSGSEWIVHSTRRHWIEFFEEKFKIHEKTEMDPDLPEFDEFMQD